MQVTLKRENEDYLFNAQSSSGVTIPIDNTSEDNPQGASPMELLLMGVGACSAIDVVAILKKQRQRIDAYSMRVNGERHQLEGAKPFKSVEVEIFLEGDIDPKKAIRAAALSFEKYCSVSLTLEPCVPVSYRIVLNGSPIAE